MSVEFVYKGTGHFDYDVEDEQIKRARIYFEIPVDGAAGSDAWISMEVKNDFNCKR